MAVSLDFLSTQFTRLLEELRQMKVSQELDRDENRRRIDRAVEVMGSTLGRFEASWEIGLQEMTQRIDSLEKRLGQVDGKLDTMSAQLSRIEQFIVGIAKPT
jgi:hypothetical protein